jgi:simple sugar transport system permease protein
MSFLLQVLRITVPYALAALGGVISERAGIINIALEGTLLAGALGGAVGAYYGHGPWPGLICGVACGIALQLVHALASVRLRADQIVSGLAANLLALGGTRFLLKWLFDSSANSPRIPAFQSSAVLLGLAAVLAVLVHALLQSTRFGLRVRACGENPAAAASLGVAVARVRVAAVALAGALCGLGGVYLAFEQRKFVDNLSAGRGYVALAAVIFGRWRPVPACAACLLFGFAEAAQIRLQTTGVGIPTQLVQILPYAVTLLTLCGAVGRARAPAALGRTLE